jgi:2-keto-4-pentenoate hydratase
VTRDNLRAELEAARREARVANIAVSDLPENIHEAYAFAFSLIEESEVAAWKIGGANPWSQAAFGNTDPFFGALKKDELFLETHSIPLAGLYEPLAEPEIMLEIGSLPDAQGNATFTRMGLGVEIPASVLPDVAKQRLIGQIVDRAGAGLIWVGDIVPFDASALEGFTLKFGKVGGELSEGGSHNVVWGLAEAVRSFLRIAKSIGAPLEQGQWIATAGLVKAIRIAPGDEVVIETANMSLKVGFA